MPNSLLIRHGRIFRDGRVDPDADSILVIDGAIAAIGREEDLHAVAPGGSKELDARGGLITHGFTDAHIHPVQGGLERLSCDLSGSSGAEETRNLLLDYAARHPERNWIVGGGWRMPHYPGGMPLAEELDRLLPGRRVYLVNADHHGAWASSAAMVAAGVDDTTPDPVDGRIDRLADGSPSGTFQEGAMSLFDAALPRPDASAMIAAIVEAQSYLHSLGVTAWHDAILGSYAGGGDATDAYLTAIDDGRLVSRVSAALWLERGLAVDGVEERVASLVSRRDRIGRATSPAGGEFAATAVKIMYDGVIESSTAAMLEPYLLADGSTGPDRGTTHFSPDVLAAVVRGLAAAGLQAHIHAIGDRAARDALDALESLPAPAGSPPLRHHLAHLQQVAPPDVERMSRLGAVATLQPLWACLDDQMVDLTAPLVGTERLSAQYPFASLRRAGAELAMGSDWPVSTPDPWQAIHVAVTRREPGSSRPALGTDEELTLAEILTAATEGSAQVAHLGSGRLAVGIRADLAITDRDPFAVGPDELSTIRNVATVVAGRVVFTAPPGD